MEAVTANRSDMEISAPHSYSPVSRVFRWLTDECPAVVQLEAYDPLVGVPPLAEQVWSMSFGCPQFGHLGGGGKLLCMMPMVAGDV